MIKYIMYIYIEHVIMHINNLYNSISCSTYVSSSKTVSLFTESILYINNNKKILFFTISWLISLYFFLFMNEVKEVKADNLVK